MIIVVNLQHVSVIFFGHIQGGVFTNDMLQTQTNVKIKKIIISFKYVSHIIR